MYKVQQNIPIPTTNRGGAVYPFKHMKIGDSFLAPKEKRPSISSCIAYYKSKNRGTNFTIRLVSSNEIRIWRIQ